MRAARAFVGTGLAGGLAAGRSVGVDVGPLELHHSLLVFVRGDEKERRGNGMHVIVSPRTFHGKWWLFQ